MKSIFRKNRRSLVAPKEDYQEEKPENQQRLFIRGLIKANYDVQMNKHGWVNAAVNVATPLENPEMSFRVYRAELRGSHLVLFRSPAGMNVRSFKVPQTDPIKKLPPLSSETLTLATRTPGENKPSESPDLSYTSLTTPHPALKIDRESGGILPGNDPEPVVHYFLFADDVAAITSAVALLVTTLPMLPNFPQHLNVLLAYLVALFKNRLDGDTSPFVVADRVTRLVKHTVENFGGFLLRPSVAQPLLKTLELLQEHLAPELDMLLRLRLRLLDRQKTLLDLISFPPPAPPVLPSKDPYVELSLAVFRDMDLFELAALVTNIELHFFALWNSLLDKLLLLASTVQDRTSDELFFRKNPLVFNNDCNIHFLARLLVHHLFCEDPGLKTAEKRARILERWIDLGCLLDKSGNMSSWLGILSVILSQPILRLSAVWSHVDPEYIKLVRNDWLPVLFELDRRYLANSNERIKFGNGPAFVNADDSDPTSSKESYHIMAPRGLGKIYSKDKVIPYFGDLLINNNAHVCLQDLETIWKKVNYSFDKWNDYLKNLSNLPEIIEYNQENLRRYNSMGFVVSNEGLNQVLYLGVNKDETNLALADDGHPKSTMSAESKQKVHACLLRLLELNEEPCSLEDVMDHSLRMEPAAPEKYVLPQPSLGALLNYPKVLHLHHNSSSNLSLHSGSSGYSTTILPHSQNSQEGDLNTILTTNTISEVSPHDRLPVFNNNHFKIDISKYDALAEPSSQSPDDSLVDDHRIVVNNDLTLRIDDFVPDFDSSLTAHTTGNSSEETPPEKNGLGIDVDDILNSDKFKAMSLEEHHDKEKLARHRSFGLVSNYSAKSSKMAAPKYIPRFASIDTLVDLMLVDSLHFCEVHPIDQSEFRYVFMLNYSSFISTRDLLDKLAQRFVHSGNAVISIMKKQTLRAKGLYDPVTFGVFPNWEVDEKVNLADLGDVDYELLLQIQINILKCLYVLLSSFYGNFASDLGNKRIMIQFFKLYSNEILQWYNSSKIDRGLDRYFEDLVNCYKKLKKLFVKKTYRPAELLRFDHFLIHKFRFSNTLHDVPLNRNLPSHKNINKIEKFIDKFNRFLTVFYKGIRPEDWFAAYKLLENQHEKLSLLNYDIPKTSEELLPVSNIFSYFDTLKDVLDQELLKLKLPLVFRKLFQLYYKFKCYLFIQICDANITTEERLDRMKTVLIMIKLLQLRMHDNQFVFEGDHGPIPSCIETAAVNVVYHPFCRQLSNMWVRASNSLNSLYPEFIANNSFNNVASLLPIGLKDLDLLMSLEPLLPCFGWIFENLIEINRCPNFHRNAINFNKRYLVYKLIKELSIEDVEEKDHPESGEFDFLLKLDESLCQLVNLSRLTGLERIKIPLFRATLKEQLAINELELQKRESRSAKSELHPTTSRITRRTLSNLKRQLMNYKTNASLRFKISGLFNRLNSAASERIVDFDELPDPASVADGKTKPSYVIPLKDRKIFPVYLVLNCLKIDSDHGDSVFIRTSSELDMKDWMAKLTWANRHWFFLRQLNLRVSNSTFCVPLAALCERDKATSPAVLTAMYEVIERDGIDVVGVYRISASISELTGLKAEIDRTGTIDFSNRFCDVHALTSCVKLFFRELPDSILTDDVLQDLYLFTQGTSNQDKLLEPYGRILKKLPPANYHTLKALVHHLHRLAEHSEKNRMTPTNLATVIGPALTEASEVEFLVNNFGFMNFILERFIENYDIVFA